MLLTPAAYSNLVLVKKLSLEIKGLASRLKKIPVSGNLINLERKENLNNPETVVMVPSPFESDRSIDFINEKYLDFSIDKSKETLFNRGLTVPDSLINLERKENLINQETAVMATLPFESDRSIDFINGKYLDSSIDKSKEPLFNSGLTVPDPDKLIIKETTQNHYSILIASIIISILCFAIPHLNFSINSFINFFIIMGFYILSLNL